MSSKLDTHTFTINAIQTNLDQMLDFIVANAIKAGLSEQERYDVQMGCEEVLVNIIHYAYPEKSGCVDINCTHNVTFYRLLVTICDNGKAFDPLSVPEPDISVPTEKRTIGGLGIYLLRKMFDRIEYNRIEEVNQLMLYKK